MCLPQRRYLVQISYFSGDRLVYLLKMVAADNYEAFEEAISHHLPDFKAEEWKIYYYSKCGTF